ncbi:hypothetical protein [Streptomyces goshikiensis]|uniref:hypothetical protein n=1 Tax=Streptomyces goshikiensis TaxID=1942 RepID=UPI0035ECEC00
MTSSDLDERPSLGMFTRAACPGLPPGRGPDEDRPKPLIAMNGNFREGDSKSYETESAAIAGAAAVGPTIRRTVVQAMRRRPGRRAGDSALAWGTGMRPIDQKLKGFSSRV